MATYFHDDMPGVPGAAELYSSTANADTKAKAEVGEEKRKRLVEQRDAMCITLNMYKLRGALSGLFVNKLNLPAGFGSA